MSETMKELLIKQRDNVVNKVLGYTFLVVAVLALPAAILVSPFFIIAIVGGGIASFLVYFRRMSVEYEYTYLDNEIRIDRIYNTNSRKQVDTIDLNKMEILAVKGSDALRGYAHRQAAVSDYSAGEDTDETKVYELWYDGKRKILVSFNDDFMAPIVRFYPQKVKKS
ncbi:MAG: hypothetical protein IKS60_08465 [Lachnospiraceae bacterium]|nr:hypothetical protein [Lachnospiraceae bacterium]